MRCVTDFSSGPVEEPTVKELREEDNGDGSARRDEKKPMSAFRRREQHFRKDCEVVDEARVVPTT